MNVIHVIRAGRRRSRLAAIAVAVLLLTGALGSPIVFAVTDATLSVQKSTAALLKRLAEVKPIYASDPEQFFAQVEDSLAPHIDFEGFSSGVMAKHYRRASAEQKSAFALKFRKSLVRTYAKALLEFDNQRVVVKDGEVSRRPEHATVLLEIHGQNGRVYPVDYNVIEKDGQWMLRNVVIDGINVGLQFRSQFAASMEKNANDIDRVIETWDLGK